jgi:hypothetical protein
MSLCEHYILPSLSTRPTFLSGQHSLPLPRCDWRVELAHDHNAARIVYPVVKLSQFATSHATIHYDAVYGIFQYLSGTRDDGLTDTRPEPLTWGPVLRHTPLHSQPTDRINEHVPTENLMTLYGYSGADWAMDTRHRRYISGMVFFLVGDVVAWKTRVQPTVALSTAESEFLAASDTARLGLFIRAVLAELLQPQHAATTVYEDNDACCMVADSTAPTHQMRHIAIRDFALQDWTERTLYHSQPVP